MEIIYINGSIVDAKVGNPRLQGKLTLAERVAIFAASSPNATVMTKTRDLERETATYDSWVDTAVAQGVITSGRGDELKA